MEDSKEFPLLGWWVIVGFFGMILVLGIIGTQYYNHNQGDLRVLLAIVLFGLMMAIGRKSFVNRKDKTVSTRYGLFGQYFVQHQKLIHFEMAYLQLNRMYAKGESITYRTGVISKDQRRIEIDWQSLNFPSEVPDKIFEFLIWLNVSVQLEGEFEKYATDHVKRKVSKLLII